MDRVFGSYLGAAFPQNFSLPTDLKKIIIKINSFSTLTIHGLARFGLSHPEII